MLFEIIVDSQMFIHSSTIYSLPLNSLQQCSGDCFNLTKGRSIVCIKDDGFAPDEDCNVSEKPKSEEVCQMHEVDYCSPRWHYSEWSDCSKKCGGGTQRRIVKCLQPNLTEGQMKESNNCKYSDRELAYKACNEHDCRGK